MAVLARANGGNRGILLEFGTAPELKGTGPTISTSFPRTVSGEGGLTSYHYAGSAAETAVHALNWYTGTKERDTFYRHCVRPEGSLGGTRTIIRYYTTEGELMGSVDVTTAAKLIFKNGAGTEVASLESGLPNKEYTVIEAKFWVHATEKEKCHATYKVNGTQIYNNESNYIMQKANPPNGHRFGWITAETTATIDFTDMGVNDSTGAANNTYLGTKTVSSYLWAKEDKGREGVTGGAGGTTEMFKAADAPPEGVSNATKTNTSQNYSATSSTTHFYEATLNSYTELGVTTADIINLIFGTSVVSNSTITARSSAVKGISNPEITEVAENTGTTVAGTYPAGWKMIKTAYTDTPSVTKGTKPVLKWRKNVLSTDAVASCFIGMFVEWEVVTKKTEEGEAKPTLTFTGAAVGKLDPGFGVAACTLAFVTAAAGLKISQGASNATLTFTTTINTSVTEFGQAAAAIAFVATAKGLELLPGVGNNNIGFSVAVDGEVKEGEGGKGIQDNVYRWWKDPQKYWKTF